MDKETLSNYGWIVICTLVLAVMIALAGPFGNFVADAVKSTTQGLFDVNKNALDSTNLITIEGSSFNEENLTKNALGLYNATYKGSWNHNGLDKINEVIFAEDGTLTINIWSDGVAHEPIVGNISMLQNKNGEIYMVGGGELLWKVSDDGKTIYQPFYIGEEIAYWDELTIE